MERIGAGELCWLSAALEGVAKVFEVRLQRRPSTERQGLLLVLRRLLLRNSMLISERVLATARIVHLAALPNVVHLYGDHSSGAVAVAAVAVLFRREEGGAP